MECAVVWHTPSAPSRRRWNRSMSGSSGSWRRMPPIRGRRSVWRNPPAEAPRTPCVRLWASLRGWIPPRARRADLGHVLGSFRECLRRHFRGRKKKQDKTLAPQAPPGRSRLPAVRAVSGVRKLASLTGGKKAVGVSFPTKARVAGFLPMSVWMKGGFSWVTKRKSGSRCG